MPIVAVRADGAIAQFLGTGAIAGNPPRLVTAYHVVRDWPGALAISVLPDYDRLYEAKVVRTNPDTDLALLDVSGYQVPNPIQLAEDDEIRTNVQAICFEYGTTRTEGHIINLAPATRLGNVTRELKLHSQFGAAGDEMLELSFPALRGASGSPVMSGVTFRLWGVVVANVSYHLLPAQIESVIEPGGQKIEETRYLLPQALAVHVKHVRALFASVGAA